MKKITYNMSIKLVVNMPNDYDPTDVFVDMGYEFYPPDDRVHILNTDIYDCVIKSNDSKTKVL